MTRAWDEIQRAANEVLGNSQYAAGVLKNHLAMCDECIAGAKIGGGGLRCKWADKLARAAGDGRMPETAAAGGGAV